MRPGLPTRLYDDLGQLVFASDDTPEEAASRAASYPYSVLIGGRSAGRGPSFAIPTPDVELRVFGQPAPQGSKRAVRMGAKVTMVESSKRVAPWRQDVSAAAQTFVAEWERGVVGHAALNGMPLVSAPRPPWTPLDGPLVALMVFTLPKPASAPKRRRTWPQSAPDLSKLARSTEDALTTASIWHDDSRVVEYARLAKVFPDEDVDALRSPGALVRVWTMERWRGE